MPETLHRESASRDRGTRGRYTALLITVAVCLLISRSAPGEPGTGPLTATALAAPSLQSPTVTQPAQLTPRDPIDPSIRLLPLGSNYLMVSEAPAPAIDEVVTALQQRRWSDALRILSAVLENNPAHMEAAYLQAVASRERAKTLPYFDAAYTPTNRHNGAWTEAIDRFEALISHDSTYRDVLYQYALLWRYAEKFEHAIEIGHAQLRLRPELAHVRHGLLRCYRLFVFDNPRSAARRLKNANRDLDRYFYAEALRVEGEILEAELTLRDLLWEASPEMPVQPILLSLARIYYAQDAPERAEERIFEAVAGVSTRVEAAPIFDEIAFVVSDEELEAYRRLETPQELRRFFETFWAERDPAPSLPWNARMAEHYRRLLKAEQDYVHTGLPLSTTDPDGAGMLEHPSAYELNELFNDKGLIYIRHGEPADKIAAGGFLHSRHGGSNLPDDMNVMKTTGGGRPANPDVGEMIPDKSMNQAWLPNESWRYDDPRMDFHFVVEGGGSNWRLAPTFPLNEATIGSREHWGGIYADLANLAYLAGEKPEFVRPMQRLALRSDLERDSRRAVELGLTAERHTWAPDVEPFDVPFLTAAFRGMNGKSRLELHFSIPTGVREGAASDSMQVEMGLALHDAGHRPIVRSLRDVTFPGGAEPDDGVTGHVGVDVRPDSYQVAFHVRPKGTGRLAAHKFHRPIPDFSGKNLHVSDLIPTYRVELKDGASGASRSEFRIAANPSLRFSRAQPIFLYFEIYNLTYSPEDRTNYLLSYSLSDAETPGLLDRMFDRQKPTLTLTVEHDGLTATSFETSQLDVAEMSRGRYRLDVRVADQVSGASASSHTFIEIY